MMNISNDTAEVIKFLESIATNKLSHKEYIGILLEIGAAFNLPKQINEIIFTGKSIWNLHSKIIIINTESEGYNLIKIELEKSISELERMLKQILTHADNTTINNFHKTFLRADKSSRQNIIELSYGLALLKELQSVSKSIK